jgi:hypothetical protein
MRGWLRCPQLKGNNGSPSHSVWFVLAGLVMVFTDTMEVNREHQPSPSTKIDDSKYYASFEVILGYAKIILLAFTAQVDATIIVNFNLVSLHASVLNSLVNFIHILN